MKGWNCFDYMTAISLSGDLTDDKVSLTSAAVNGQVITVTGSVSKLVEAGPYIVLAGTYTIRGDCADGDKGSVTGNTVGSVARYWGEFYGRGWNYLLREWPVTEDGPSLEGSYGISGQISTDNSCLKSGTITSGIFPDASYILGNSVVLEIKTDSGVLTFLGTADSGGIIRGIYKVDSGPCISTGTGYLSPWE